VNFGQAKNSWLTGTAAWNYYVISNYVLGIKPDWNGLTIDPCIPKDWAGYKISRRFRGAIYEIEIKNESKVCKGVKKLIADGEEISGNTIPAYGDGKVHKITAIL
ncbi:MAG: glycosyl transferase, partial [Clostridia bacterium]|nr:glycosyl transferase [Clostridia bacterium]